MDILVLVYLLSVLVCCGSADASVRPSQTLAAGFNDFSNGFYGSGVAGKLDDLIRSIKEGNHLTSQMTAKLGQNVVEVSRLYEAKVLDLEAKLAQKTTECHKGGSPLLEDRLTALEQRLAALEEQNQALLEQLRDEKTTIPPEEATLGYDNNATFSEDNRTTLNTNTLNSAVVAFDAFRNRPFHLAQSYLNFDGTLVNVGNAFDVDSGAFKAPLAGIYAFHFHALTQDGSATYVKLILNGRNVGGAYRRHEAEQGEHGEQNTTFLKKAEGMLSQSVILELQPGDEVRVFAYHGNLRDGGWHYTHFNGYLIALI